MPPFAVSSTAIVEIGAVISGVLSLIGAGFSIKRVVAYCDKQCDLRMRAYRSGEQHEQDDPHRHSGERGERGEQEERR